MTTAQTFVILDEIQAGLQTGPLAWTTQSNDNDFGGSHIYPDFSLNTRDSASPTTPGWVMFEFEGTSVSVRGTTAVGPQDFLVSIDEAPIPYKTSTDDTSPQNYLQWYQSPLLPPGKHTLNISNIRATSIDAVIVTPGPDTEVAGKTLLVDDTSPEMKFMGQGWKTSPRPFQRRFSRGQDRVYSAAIQNGTHETTTVGDGVFFAFTGTRAKVYGVLLGTPGSSLILSTAVDDAMLSYVNRTYYRPRTGSDDSPDDQCHFMLADTEVLPAGSHRFEVRLNATNEASFIIDYILYEPTFSTLSSKPDLSAMEPNLDKFQTPSTEVTPTASSRTKVNIGAVVGAVAGIVLFLSAISVIIFLLHRRRQRKRQQPEESIFYKDLHTISPYTVISKVPLPQPQITGSAKRHLISESSPVPSYTSGSTSQLLPSTTVADIARRLQGLQDMLTLPGTIGHFPHPSRSQGHRGIRMSVTGESTAPPAYQSAVQ